jgi:hypothetical protein
LPKPVRFHLRDSGRTEKSWQITCLTRSNTLNYPGSDPVDHERATRQHAGESLKDGTNAPGLAGVVAGVIALIVGLFALATGHAGIGAAAVIVAAVAATAGVAWLMLAHRRVRDAELAWAAGHSDDTVPPPSG